MVYQLCAEANCHAHFARHKIRHREGFIRAIYRYFREPVPGISHLVGTALSVAGLIVLLWLAHGRPWQTVGFAIYGASLVLLYLASTLCHSLPVGDKGVEKLDRLDRAAIFGLIAGTYTPICLVSLRGGWGWSLLGVEWGLAMLGIIGIFFNRPRRRWVRTVLYVAMAWAGLVVFPQVSGVLPAGALGWLFAGGVVYTLGAVVFFTNWPPLWRGRFVAHDLWHVMVLAGSACHFMVMARYVA